MDQIDRKEYNDNSGVDKDSSTPYTGDGDVSDIYCLKVWREVKEKVDVGVKINGKSIDVSTWYSFVSESHEFNKIEFKLKFSRRVLRWVKNLMAVSLVAHNVEYDLQHQLKECLEEGTEINSGNFCLENKTYKKTKTTNR